MILSLEVRIRCCQCQQSASAAAARRIRRRQVDSEESRVHPMRGSLRTRAASSPRFRSSRTRGDSCTRSTRPSLSHLRPQNILRQLPKTMMTQHAIRGLSGATALPRLRTSHASLRGVSRAVAPARALVSRRGRANTVVVKGKSSLSEPTNPRPLPGADTVSPSMECSCPPRHFDDGPKLTTSLPDLPLDTQPRRPTGAASFPPRSFASARVC